jgi:hypothetical protein
MVHTVKAVEAQPQAAQVVVQEVEQVVLEQQAKDTQAVLAFGLLLVAAVVAQQVLVAMVVAQ